MTQKTDSKAVIGYMIGILLAIAMIFIQKSEYEKAIAELEQQIELKDEKIALLERSLQETSMSGGEEVPPEVVDAPEGYVFPIHTDDFLFYTSPYGLRVSPILGIEMKHTGLDIASTWRAQVVSMEDGVIIEHWPAPGTPFPGGGVYKGHPTLGGKIVIDHGSGVQSTYGHLSWTRVHEGMRVVGGEILGRVGNTGKATGMHLHFEVSINGEPVNPLLYVSLE